MFIISPTNHNWFEFLKHQGMNEELNFWTPTPWNLKCEQGDRLYFMLKSPIRKVGGGGVIKEYRNLTVEKAWNEYGIRNGFSSKEELMLSLTSHRSHNTPNKSDVVSSTEIGCIILENVVFLDEADFIDLNNIVEINFPKQIVKYKKFDDSIDYLSTKVFDKIYKSSDYSFKPISPDVKKDKINTVVTLREGQSEFRAGLIGIYSKKCCVTGENTPELLEAAHIQPYLTPESNHLQNGLLLRTDIHKLFDNGLLWIDNEYRVQVSSHVSSSYYKQLNGRQIHLPLEKKYYPSQEALQIKKGSFRA